MSEHDEVYELLSAWALDACDPDEARAVEVHVATCAECAREAARLREAAGWLGALETATPPPSLQSAVMAKARAVRAPASVAPSTATELLVHQADALAALLATLSPRDWQAATDAGWTVHELVGHLLAAASYLTWQLGLLPEDLAQGETAWVPRSEAVINGEREHDPAETAAAWRVQADLLRTHVASAGPDELGRLIPWFGGQAPLAALAIVHAFETWVHAEDIRRAVGRLSQAPSPADLTTMSRLAVRLLSDAMLDPSYGAKRARLVLTGQGGGEWSLPFGDDADDGPGIPAVTLAADVVEFCTLIGGRMRPDDLPCHIEGDMALAGAMLSTAASFAFP